MMFNGLNVIEHDPDAGCEECPFAEWHEAAWSYKCVRLGAWVYDGKDSAPDACPIRDGAIMVSGDFAESVENLRRDAVMEGERREAVAQAEANVLLHGLALIVERHGCRGNGASLPRDLCALLDEATKARK